MVTVLVLTFDVSAAVAVSLTVYVPSLEYTWVGDAVVEVVLSPKSQLYVVAWADVFVNVTVAGAMPAPENVKPAVTALGRLSSPELSLLEQLTNKLTDAIVNIASWALNLFTVGVLSHVSLMGGHCICYVETYTYPFSNRLNRVGQHC